MAQARFLGMKFGIGMLVASSMFVSYTAFAVAPDWCGQGKNQSPINIERPVEAVLPTLYAGHPGMYQPLTIANGVVSFPDGHSLGIDSKSWSLKAMQLFKPSAHFLNGKASAYEIQLRFESNGNTLMLSMLVNEGGPQVPVSHLVSALEAGQNESSTKFRLSEFMSTHTGYYRYNGSEMSAPCEEGIEWLIIYRPLSASELQLQALEKLIGLSATREVQPLNARVVLK